VIFFTVLAHGALFWRQVIILRCYRPHRALKLVHVFKELFMQENEIVVLSDVEIEEVSGAGSFANAVGYAVGYILQKSASYYGSLGPDAIV